jgi:hypothetical protein
MKADLQGCTIERPGIEDIDSVLDLFNMIYPDSPTSRESLLWQHFSPPAGQSLLYSVNSDQKVVSIYSAVRKLLKVGTELVPAFMVQDVMTDPQYRGRGFLNHLGSLCQQEIRASGYSGYTFPNKLSENSFRRAKWDELMTVPYREVIPKEAGRSSSAAAEGVESFGDDATEIWNNAGFTVGVNRNSAYLNWRYSRPETKYHKFMFSEGFVVLKVFNRDDGPVVHICELVMSSRDDNDIISSLGFIRDFAIESGAVLITAWLPNEHPYSEAYNSFGLNIDPSMDRMIFTTGPQGILPVLANAANWHISQGDSDVY